MRHVETIVTGRWRENCYVVHADAKSALVVDPGEDFDRIVAYLERHSLNVLAILATHAHYDHIGSVAELKARYGAPFHLHAADHRLLRQANFYRAMFGGERSITIPEVDVDLAACETLRFGASVIGVMHTPGHTPGSVAFLTEECLFCGDTIFGQRIGRTDLPGGDKAALMASVQRLARLPGTTKLFPGHGAPFGLAEVFGANGDLVETPR